MSQNPTITMLDIAQALKRTYNEADDAIRVELGSSTGFNVAIDTADGDNIAVLGLSSSTKVSMTSASTGVVVPAFSVAGLKSFNLYTNTTSTITGPQEFRFEISPSDTDDVWIATPLRITPSTTNGVVVMAESYSNIVARRARVSIAAAISSGTVALYLVTSGG